jgi:predicted phosphoribosyltransferase
MIYKDKNEIADLLAEELAKVLDETWLIVPISKEALFFAKTISQKTGTKFELLFIDAISCQKNIECKVAFISEFKNSVFNETIRDAFQISNDHLSEALKIIHEYKIMPELEEYRGGRIPFQIPNEIENILLLDTSIETGFKMEVAIDTIEELGIEDIYIASPVIPVQMFDLLEPTVEKIFSLEKVEFYTGICDYLEEKEEESIKELEKIVLR